VHSVSRRSSNNSARNFTWGLTASVFGLLCTTSVLSTLDGTHTEYLRFAQATVFSLALWTLLLAAVRRVWLALVLASPVALFLPVEIWMRVGIGEPTSSRSVALLAETSPAEAANFLATYGATLIFWCAAWALIYGAAVWMAYRHSLAWRSRANTWCLLIIPAVFLIHYVELGSPPWLAEARSADPFDSQLLEGWSHEWEDIFPVNLAVAVQQYGYEMKKLQRVRSVLQRQSLNARLLAPATAPEVVVLVVGESASATHWGMLGYARKTTPRLEAEDKLVAFSDVVALSTATRSAVPGVLSRRPVMRPDSSVDLQAEPSLVKAFGEAGYRTHWFSNQSPFGNDDSSIAVYAREAEDLRFFNPSTFKSKSNFDEILLNPLEAVLKSPGRHLVVLHSLGSHFNYALRYPDSFDHFTPSSKNLTAGELAMGDANERIANSYDNSILYSDFFLSEVIRAVKARGGRSLVAYFSDHGNDLPGGKCSFRGVTRIGESAYRVPVFFWFSDAMQRDHRVEWQRLRKNRSDPYMTRAMFSTLLELAGVGISGELPDQSFLRTDPKHGPRMVGGIDRMVDFDRARAHNACRVAGYR
jgi:glucan phosphoethanolaminetransferase (alkaline phosphatase superfamily)